MSIIFELRSTPLGVSPSFTLVECRSMSEQEIAAARRRLSRSACAHCWLNRAVGLRFSCMAAVLSLLLFTGFSSLAGNAESYSVQDKTQESETVFYSGADPDAAPSLPASEASLRLSASRQPPASASPRSGSLARHLALLIPFFAVLLVYGALRWRKLEKQGQTTRAAEEERSRIFRESLLAYEAKSEVRNALVKELQEERSFVRRLEAEVERLAKETAAKQEELQKVLKERDRWSRAAEALEEQAAEHISEMEAMQAQAPPKTYIEEPRKLLVDSVKLYELKLARQKVESLRREAARKMALHSAVGALCGDPGEKEVFELFQKVDEETLEAERLEDTRVKFLWERSLIYSRLDKMNYAGQSREAVEKEAAVVEAEVHKLEKELESAKTVHQFLTDEIETVLNTLNSLKAQVPTEEEPSALPVVEYERQRADLFKLLSKWDEADDESERDGEEQEDPGSAHVGLNVLGGMVHSSHAIFQRAMDIEILNEHEELRTRLRETAKALVAGEVAGLEEDLKQLRERLQASDANTTERHLLARRIKQIKKKMDGAFDEALKRANEVRGHKCLVRETELIRKFRANGIIVSRLKDMWEKDALNEDIQVKLLRSMMEFENVRRELLSALDVASLQYEQLSLSKIIGDLFISPSSPSVLEVKAEKMIASSRKQYEVRLEEAKKRKELTKKRIICIRKGIQAELVAGPGKGPLGESLLGLRARLLRQRTLFVFYTEQSQRLLNVLDNFETRQRDRVHEAVALWEEQSGYQTAEFKLEALGGTLEALSQVPSFERNLGHVELFEWGTEADDELFAKVEALEDNKALSDLSLLGLPEVETMQISTLMGTAVPVVSQYKMDKSEVYADMNLSLLDAEDFKSRIPSDGDDDEDSSDTGSYGTPLSDSSEDEDDSEREVKGSPSRLLFSSTEPAGFPGVTQSAEETQTQAESDRTVQSAAASTEEQEDSLSSGGAD